MGNSVRRSRAKQPASKSLADHLASIIGSWKFIGVQATILTLWVIVNAVGDHNVKWDKPPYILLNLMLSFQAAFTAPVLLMSANRQTELDRKRDIEHYLIDVHGNEILEEMSAQVDRLHQLQHEGMDEEHW